MYQHYFIKLKVSLQSQKSILQDERQLEVSIHTQKKKSTHNFFNQVYNCKARIFDQLHINAIHNSQH